MNALYISYDGMTDPLGQSQVIPYLIGLADKGVSVTILSAEKKENYSKNEKHVAKLLKDHKVKWECIFYTKNPPVISTLYDLYRLRKKANKLLIEYTYDLIHCRSYLPMLIGVYFKKTKHIKLVFDMRGFWADERLDGKIWDVNKPVYNYIYKFFKKKEKEFLRLADAIVVLTNKSKEIIRKWDTKLQEEDITVIPCSVDLDHFQLAEKKDHHHYDKLNIDPHNFIITYVGSLGTWYMLDEMLNFFKVMLETKPEATFLFITKDSPELILQKLPYFNIESSRVKIYGTDRIELPKIMSLSDISIFFILPSFSKQASSPTKQGELLSMGIPIIANAGVGDNDYIFGKHPVIGELVMELNVKGYQAVIDKIEKICVNNKSEIREVARLEFDLNKGVDKYYYIYNRLCLKNEL